MSWWPYTNARRHAHTQKHLKYAHSTSDSSTFEVLQLWEREREMCSKTIDGRGRSGHDVRGIIEHIYLWKHRVDISKIERLVGRDKFHFSSFPADSRGILSNYWWSIETHICGCCIFPMDKQISFIVSNTWLLLYLFQIVRIFAAKMFFRKWINGRLKWIWTWMIFNMFWSSRNIQEYWGWHSRMQ